MRPLRPYKVSWNGYYFNNKGSIVGKKCHTPALSTQHLLKAIRPAYASVSAPLVQPKQGVISVCGGKGLVWVSAGELEHGEVMA